MLLYRNAKLLTLTFSLALSGSGAIASESIPEACGTKDALSTCLNPQGRFLVPEAKNSHSYYVAESIRYFLSMKTDQSTPATIAKESDDLVRDFFRPLEKGEWNPINHWFSSETIHPHYSPLSIRYEFPPWLLTTGYGEITLKNVDESLRNYDTDYKSIDCIFVNEQPFGRCHVVFLYGKDDPKTPEDDRTECPIYEEFTFSDQGKMTFIEAWTDHAGYLPMPVSDHWASGPNVKRMSTSVPGLGNDKGLIDPASKAMIDASFIFDKNYQSEFWDISKQKLGPFASMLHDMSGKIDGVQLPAAGIVSIWPSWLQRTAAHKDILGGCSPPTP